MLTWRYLYIVLTHLIKGEMSFQLNKEDNMCRKCMALTGVEIHPNLWHKFAAALHAQHRVF